MCLCGSILMVIFRHREYVGCFSFSVLFFSALWRSDALARPSQVNDCLMYWCIISYFVCYYYLCQRLCAFHGGQISELKLNRFVDDEIIYGFLFYSRLYFAEKRRMIYASNGFLVGLSWSRATAQTQIHRIRIAISVKVKKKK